MTNLETRARLEASLGLELRDKKGNLKEKRLYPSKSTKVSGESEMILVDEKGEIIASNVAPNLITDAGFDFLCDVAGNPTQPAPMGYIAIGTGTTAPSASDTGLENEVLREAATYSHTTGTKVWKLEATFNFTTNYAITESGCLNAATGGTLLNRQTFAALNVASGDSLKVTWQFTLS